MSGVELRQLEYFVAVAEHLHFGRAARALSIGQPAVSQQVARLERTLGTVLFDRNPRTVRLTESGVRLLPRARAALAAVERARESVLGPAELAARPLRIGTCSGLGERLDVFLRTLERLRPGTTVELVNTPSRSRLERVAAGQLDAAFVRGVTPPDGVELLEVWQDRVIAALPAHHPLAARPRVAVADLAALPLRIVAHRANPALVELVMGHLADAGHAPRRIEHDGLPVDTLLATVASGPPSWTVLSESHASTLRGTHVAFVPTQPAMVITTSLAVPADASSRAVAPLIEACAAAAAARAA